MKEPIYVEIKKGKVDRTIQLHRVLEKVKTKSLIFLDVNKKNELLGIEIIKYIDFTPSETWSTTASDKWATSDNGKPVKTKVEKLGKQKKK